MTCRFVSLTLLKTQGHVQSLGRCCPPKAFRSPWACVLVANSAVICRINTASHTMNVCLSPPEVNIIHRYARNLAPRIWTNSALSLWPPLPPSVLKQSNEYISAIAFPLSTERGCTTGWGRDIPEPQLWRERGWLLKPGSLVPGKFKSIWAFSLKQENVCLSVSLPLTMISLEVRSVQFIL